MGEIHEDTQKILKHWEGGQGCMYIIFFIIMIVSIIGQAIFSWKVMSAVYQRVNPSEQMKGLKSIKRALGGQEDLLQQFIEAKKALDDKLDADVNDVENPREP